MHLMFKDTHLLIIFMGNSFTLYTDCFALRLGLIHYIMYCKSWFSTWQSPKQENKGVKRIDLRTSWKDFKPWNIEGLLRKLET